MVNLCGSCIKYDCSFIKCDGLSSSVDECSGYTEGKRMSGKAVDLPSQAEGVGEAVKRPMTKQLLLFPEEEMNNKVFEFHRNHGYFKL